MPISQSSSLFGVTNGSKMSPFTPDPVVRTSDFTASAGAAYAINTSSAAVVVTPPVSPAVGAAFAVIDFGQTTPTNVIRLSLSAQKYYGQADDLVINVAGASVVLEYAGPVIGWVQGPNVSLGFGVYPRPYQGATVSQPGVSGLVPSAPAGQQNYLLRGDGTYQAPVVLPTNMTGATPALPGTSGLVPAPSAGQQLSYFSGDGTYRSGVNLHGSTRYDVASTHASVELSGTFDFYQDPYFIFRASGGLIYATSVAVGRNIGVYGFDIGGAASGLPITNTSTVLKGGYAGLTPGTYTAISAAATTSDYDDFQTYWIQATTISVMYRITTMGGTTKKFLVERWLFTQPTSGSPIVLA